MAIRFRVVKIFIAGANLKIEEGPRGILLDGPEAGGAALIPWSHVESVEYE